MTLLEWSALGHVLGLVLATVLAEWGRRQRRHGAAATALLHATTSAIDRQKNIVHAEHDPNGALILKGLTTTIAGEALAAGLLPHLDAFLKAHGLNQTKKLADTRRLPPPEGHPRG